MQHTLPQLPYAQNALEPNISARTLEFHYGKHHQAYVDNLNKLIINTEYENIGLEEIIKQADGPIFNNAAQIYNHTFYFEGLSPDVNEPADEILEIINKNFSDFNEFKNKFSEAAKTLFGSGWVWLVQKEDNSLEIVQTKNADNPLKNNLKPLLTIDVWEHAYYLDYQNKRPEYIANYFNIINWKKINERLTK